MKIKKGDTVIVIAGKDRGKIGEVTSVLKEESRVVVAGVNVVKRHKKNRAAGKGKGQVIEKTMPIHVSNVQITEDGKPTRVRIERKDGKRMRTSVKTGKEIS